MLPSDQSLSFGTASVDRRTSRRLSSAATPWNARGLELGDYYLSPAVVGASQVTISPRRPFRGLAIPMRHNAVATADPSRKLRVLEFRTSLLQECAHPFIEIAKAEGRVVKRFLLGHPGVQVAIFNCATGSDESEDGTTQATPPPRSLGGLRKTFPPVDDRGEGGKGTGS